jgi:methylated-DNA-[protein]-cysteine S-methyltransferase
MITNFQNRVYNLCKKIPKGKVTTYKIIARKLNSKAYRAVGSALKSNPFAPIVPCHRVVNSDSSIGGFQGKRNSKKKKELLNKEGIIIKNGKIKEFEKKKYYF